MKKTSLRKEILVALAVILLTIALSSSVFATSDAPISPVVINGIGVSNIVDTTNTTVENNTVNTINTIAPVNNTVINTTPIINNTVSNYENTSLPQTGDASDYAVFALIGVAAVAGIFAFKKARDYNI